MHFLGSLACLLAFSTQVLSQKGCSGSVTSGGGRKIAVVVDSSGSMTETDPSNLRLVAGKSITNSLASSDRTTVIDFDDSVRVVYPLGPPAGADFSSIDSEGGTYIAGGVKAAIDELTKDPSDPTADITGIVVLTDGEDSAISDLVDQLNRATSLGIRVSFGFLSPDATSAVQDPSILAAIIGTHGIYSTISDATAQANFVNLVLTHGLTNKNSGGTSDTLLLPGLATAGNVSSTTGPETFTYDAEAGEVLNFTVTAISVQSFDILVRDKTANKDLQHATTDASGIATLTLTATETELELDVSTTNTTAGLYTISLTSSVNRTISVCGATNLTSNSTSNTTTTPSISTTPSAPFSMYTGGAEALQRFGVAAIIPALVALFL